MNRYMLDTNIFNKILDGNIGLNLRGDFFATHVQMDEILATTNECRRNQLLEIFKNILQRNWPTESSVWDVSKWDQCKWGNEEKIISTESFILDYSRMDMAKLSGDDLYIKIKNSLDQRNKKKSSNIQDALIAETAIKNNLILVTNDKDLKEVFKEYSENVMDFEKFCRITMPNN